MRGAVCCIDGPCSARAGGRRRGQRRPRHGPEPLKGGSPPDHVEAEGGIHRLLASPRTISATSSAGVGRLAIAPGTGISLRRCTGWKTPSRPQRPALRAPPQRRARHRSGQARAPDPRPGEAAADLQPRRPLVAIRWRRGCASSNAAEQPLDPDPAAGGPGGGRHPRPALQLGMDGGEAVHPARRGRRAAEGSPGCWPKAPTPARHEPLDPLAKCMDDAVIALYQNGEPIRPEQGYPMRLLLPGYSGNTNVKWLHRLKVVAAPVMTKDETSKYTALQPDGEGAPVHPAARGQVGDRQAVLRLPTCEGPGVYQISGVAWSGKGASARSRSPPTAARAGRRRRWTTWPATKAVMRFRMPWRWDGQPKRADEPRHRRDGGGAADARGLDGPVRPGQFYFFNGIRSGASAPTAR